MLLLQTTSLNVVSLPCTGQEQAQLGGYVTLYTNTLTWERIKKAKRNGMSWIVDKPILKLRNDLRKKFMKEGDSKVVLGTGCFRIASVYLYLLSHNPWSRQLKLITVKMLTYSNWIVSVNNVWNWLDESSLIFFKVDTTEVTYWYT